MASVSCSSAACNQPALRHMSHPVVHRGEREMVSLWLCRDCAGELERRAHWRKPVRFARLRRSRKPTAR